MNGSGSFSLVALEAGMLRYAAFVELERRRERSRMFSPLTRKRARAAFAAFLVVFMLVDVLAFLGALVLFVASDSLLVFVVSSVAFTLVVVKMTRMALAGTRDPEIGAVTFLHTEIISNDCIGKH